MGGDRSRRAPADRLTTPEGVVLGLAPRRREEAVALHARVSAVGSDRLWAVLVDLAYWSWLRERHGSTARATSSSDRGRPPADADNVVALLQARLGDAVCEARRVPPLRGPAVVVVYEGALDRLPQVLLHPGPEVHFSAEEAGALWTRWHARHEARPFAAGADVLEFQVPQPVPPESSAALAAEHRCYGAVTLDGDRWRFRW